MKTIILLLIWITFGSQLESLTGVDNEKIIMVFRLILLFIAGVLYIIQISKKK